MNIKKQKVVVQILGLLLLLTSLSAQAQIQRYDKKETRARLMAFAADTRIPQVKLKGKFKSAQEKAFVEFWLNEILPVENSTVPHVRHYIAYSLLMRSGSQNSEAEFKEWEAGLLEAMSFFNELEVSEEWTQKLKQWSELAQDLKGDLPEEARRTYRDRVMYSFEPAMKPKLDEIARLETEYETATDQVPANNHLKKAETGNGEATRLFKMGEKTFEEAAGTLTHNYKNYGDRFVGFEANQKYPDHLNTMAILRSELARSKGFKTWAEFQLSGDEGYSEAYRGVEKQREFLLGLIKALAPPLHKFVDSRIAELGLQQNQVKGEHLGLVFPQGLGHTRLYFPPEKLTEIWLTSMIESGFSSKTLGQILVDDTQRPNKNATGAFNRTAQPGYLDTEILTLNNLSLVTPKRSSPAWNPGFTYILQSYMSGGIHDLSTMFHEGGHALERTSKFKNKSRPESYAYVETPSTTMELFLRDIEVLYDKAVPIDGQKPSKEEFARLIKNTKIAEAYGLLGSATISLFDVDLWNYDYSAPGAKTFMERVEELNLEGDRLMMSRARSPSEVPHYYSSVSTSHFTSGEVRNPGYVFAEMSSIQMADFVYDELEKTTGRRTWLKQPTLAGIFQDRFFSQGWKRPFPENIESITGRKYNPAKILESILKDIDTAPKASSCNEALKL